MYAFRCGWLHTPAARLATALQVVPATSLVIGLAIHHITLPACNVIAIALHHDVHRDPPECFLRFLIDGLGTLRMEFHDVADVELLGPVSGTVDIAVVDKFGPINLPGTIFVEYPCGEDTPLVEIEFPNGFFVAENNRQAQWALAAGLLVGNAPLAP